MQPIPVIPGQTRLGWIGTGVMGVPICGHLLQAGFSATVFSRTREKAQPLLAAGASWADTPRAVAEASDVVFTMVGFPDDVRAVRSGAATAGIQESHVTGGSTISGMRTFIL